MARTPVIAINVGRFVLNTGAKDRFRVRTNSDGSSALGGKDAVEDWAIEPSDILCGGVASGKGPPRKRWGWNPDSAVSLLEQNPNERIMR